MPETFPNLIAKEKGENLNRQNLRPIPVRRSDRWISWAEAAVRSLKYLSFLVRGQGMIEVQSEWYGAVRRETERIESKNRDHNREWKQRIDISARRLNSHQFEQNPRNIPWAMAGMRESKRVNRQATKTNPKARQLGTWTESARRAVEYLHHGQTPPESYDPWEVNISWNLKSRLKDRNPWFALFADIAYRMNKQSNRE